MSMLMTNPVWAARGDYRASAAALRVGFLSGLDAFA